MLTNILLGLILGIVITSFVILNNKINNKIYNLYRLLNKIIDTELTTNINITETLKLFKTFVDKFDKRILVDNEYFEILNSSINDKFIALNHNDDCIKERLNTIDSDNTTLIIDEHIKTRNEIKKQAKISSKIKSQSKTNNNTNKQ